MTTTAPSNSNPTTPTEPHQDPQTHPDQQQRHNSDAWKDCSVPPFPGSDRHNPAFNSWQTHESPADAHDFFSSRAKGLLTFARFALDRWSEQAYKDKSPSLNFSYNDVNGFIDLLDVIGETMDLSLNAAKAMQATTVKH